MCRGRRIGTSIRRQNRTRTIECPPSRAIGIVCSGSGSHSERNDLPFPLFEEHDTFDRVDLVLRSPIAEP